MKIDWWKTKFGEEEIKRVVETIRNKNLSQGPVTDEFERKLGEYLEIDHVIAVSNGSISIVLALMALGVGPGDEVIMPNRTWIATAHAVHLLGGKVVLVDVEEGRPIIDCSLIEEKISSKTKVILPVHMNGRAANMNEIMKIAKKHSLTVIEDTQSIASKNSKGFLGTQSDIGCYSLAVAKTISTGQGGFVVTRNEMLANKIRAIRNHGVDDVNNVKFWPMPGFNFKFTDVLASIGIEQLKRLPERIKRFCDLYEIYEDKLVSPDFRPIPVDLNAGEVPIYIEYLVKGRNKKVDDLHDLGIETRPFYPSINAAQYLNKKTNEEHISQYLNKETKEEDIFINSLKYEEEGIYLPSGPDQDLTEIINSIESINTLSK